MTCLRLLANKESEGKELRIIRNLLRFDKENKMNKLISTLSVIAVVFALTLGTFSLALAEGDNLSIAVTGEANLFGGDWAHNSVVADRDRDSAPAVNFESYGLNGYRISTE